MKKILMIAVMCTAFAIATGYAVNPQSSNSKEAKQSPVVEITNNNFDTVVRGNKFVVIDFWAPWCGPCRAIAPTIEELATEYSGRVVVGKCNVDDYSGLARRFGVQGIPAIYLLKNGKIAAEQVGYCSKNLLKEKIEALIK